MMGKITQKELSQIFGIGTRQLQRLMKDGTLPKWGSPPENIIRSYIGYREKLAAEAEKKRQSDEESDIPEIDDKDRISYLKNKEVEEVKLTIEKRKKLQYQNAITRNELVKVEDVSRVWEDMVLIFRQSLLNIPAKYSTVLLDQEEPGNVKDILEEAIYESLAELSKYELDYSDEQIDETDEATGETV